MDLRSLRIYVEMLKLFSKILDEVATLESEQGRRLDEIARELLKPETFLELSKMVPQELFARFMATMLRLSVVGSKFQNFWQLPPAEKKRLSQELGDAANEFSQLLDELEKYLKRR